MIEAILQGQNNNTQQPYNTKNQAVLRMEKHSRMGGSVPVWEKQNTAKSHVETSFSNALQSQEDQVNNALAYASKQASQAHGPEEFGFGDLVDMVNPMQHIPVVNHLYRHVTGDEIKPISKIMGGTLYGGPAGAAMGVADTIVEHETGRDMAQNAMHIANGGHIELRSTVDDPQTRLELASKIQSEDAQSEIPGAALSFVDLGFGKRQVTQYEQIGDGRTAGKMARTYTEIAMPEPQREAIQTVELAAMPPRHRFSFND